MAVNFPTSLDALSNPAASDTLDNVTTPHATQHANANDILEALEAKVGTGASTPSAGTVHRGTGAGASAWGAIVDADISASAAIAATKLAAGILNAQLNADVARANLLTNGGFEVWQRGAGPFTANLSYTSDNWVLGKAGTDTTQIDREATIKKTNSRYSAKLSFTLGTGAGASKLYQVCRISDGFHGMLGQSVTVKISVRASAASAIRIGIVTDGTGGTTTYSGYHSGAAAFEELTVTVTVPTDATYVSPQIYFAATCTAYFDNAMLVIGSVAADYVPLHPADELARCQRYYWVQNYVSAYGYGAYVGLYASAGGQGIGPTIYFPVQMGGTPTMTKNGTWTVSNCAQPACVGPGPGGFNFAATSTAAGLVYWTPDSSDDTIVAEWNP